MGTSKKAEGKRSLREMAEEDVIEDDQEEEGAEQLDQCEFLGFTTGEREESAVEKKKRGKKTTAEAHGGGGGGGSVCQVENCAADMTGAKRYHKRHKVCEFHAKAASVFISGRRQRFCQQCSRFHELGEFDEAKRSCRRRLAGHNERRRKSSVEFQGGESSNRTENS